jgi:hypothetical protein
LTVSSLTATPPAERAICSAFTGEPMAQCLHRTSTRKYGPKVDRVCACSAPRYSFDSVSDGRTRRLGCHDCLRLRRRQALRRQAAHGRDCISPCDPELSGFSACGGQRPRFEEVARRRMLRDAEGTSMIFTFQFVRFRRGVPEVIGERRCDAPDQTAALARARRLVGTSDWPATAEAVRVLDDGGRTLSDWRIGDSST